MVVTAYRQQACYFFDKPYLRHREAVLWNPICLRRHHRLWLHIRLVVCTIATCRLVCTSTTLVVACDAPNMHQAAEGQTARGENSNWKRALYVERRTVERCRKLIVVPLRSYNGDVLPAGLKHARTVTQQLPPVLSCLVLRGKTGMVCRCATRTLVHSQYGSSEYCNEVGRLHCGVSCAGSSSKPNLQT